MGKAELSETPRLSTEPSWQQRSSGASNKASKNESLKDCFEETKIEIKDDATKNKKTLETGSLSALKNKGKGKIRFKLNDGEEGDVVMKLKNAQDAENTDVPSISKTAVETNLKGKASAKLNSIKNDFGKLISGRKGKLNENENIAKSSEYTESNERNEKSNFIKKNFGILANSDKKNLNGMSSGISSFDWSRNKAISKEESSSRKGEFERHLPAIKSKDVGYKVQENNNQRKGKIFYNL